LKEWPNRNPSPSSSRTRRPETCTPREYDYHVRKCIPAKQVINISEEAYRAMIENEVPDSSVWPVCLESSFLHIWQSPHWLRGNSWFIRCHCSWPWWRSGGLWDFPGWRGPRLTFLPHLSEQSPCSHSAKAQISRVACTGYILRVSKPSVTTDEVMQHQIFPSSTI
jgi:hypothetical protein